MTLPFRACSARLQRSLRSVVVAGKLDCPADRREAGPRVRHRFCARGDYDYKHSPHRCAPLDRFGVLFHVKGSR